MKVKPSDRMQTFIIFVDFQKAFDRVNRKMLLEKLKLMGISEGVVRAIQLLLMNTKARVNDQEIDIKIGTPQGGVLSP
jgi:retron-type reverse transcriptase